jgi:Uma2 family endonuclease
MPTPLAGRRYTVDELHLFPDDGNRYEIVRGELLVTPAPSAVHQLVVGEIQYRIHAYLEALGRLARVLAGPADIIYDEETWVQPDILVVPAHEVSLDWRTYRSLLLVVEVLSPSSARSDRLVKRAAYQEHGVGTYWVVDHEARAAEEWRPGDEVARIVTDKLLWQFSPASATLTINLADIWAALPPG